MSAFEIPLPRLVALEPTEHCNLRCKMCHVSYMSNIKRPMLDISVLNKLSLLKNTVFTIGAVFEPTLHPEFKKIISVITHFEGSEINLISNGTNFTDDVITVLQAAPMKFIWISFDGIKKQSYETIRRRANFENTIEKIINLRKAFQGRQTHFSVNTTMMRSNMGEIKEIIDFWDKQNFDMVHFLMMAIRDLNSDLLKESIYPVRKAYFDALDEAALDVLENNRRLAIMSPYYQCSNVKLKYPGNFKKNQVISNHENAAPYYENPHNVELGYGFGMKFPCVSPFTSARVVANGDVQLCQQFAIGNLHETNFDEIWRGEKAAKIREEILNNRSICENCDYYKFCISEHTIDYEKKENYFNHDIFKHIEAIDFDQPDKIQYLSKSKMIPALVGSFEQYNIVKFNDLFFAISRELGDVRLEEGNFDNNSSIFKAESYSALRKILGEKVPEA